MNTGGTLYTSSVTCRKHFYFKTANHDSLNALKKKKHNKQTKHTQHHTSTTDKYTLNAKC